MEKKDKSVDFSFFFSYHIIIIIYGIGIIIMSYKKILINAKNILKGEIYDISLLSNASAFINEVIKDINWVGFYLLIDNQLVLGPFNGKVACSTISLDRGVCGYSVSNNKVVVVDDVHTWDGHIACDENSRSEVVIPIIVDQKIIGCFDCDSPLLGRFNQDLVDFLIEFNKVIEKYLSDCKILLK